MQSDKRLNKITRAADQLFTQKGYSAVSMRDIADAADVNPALIYYYFKSKEELFNSIMRKRIEQLFGNISPFVSSESIPLEEKLVRITDIFYDVVSTDRNLPIFIFSEIQKQEDEFAGLIPVDVIMSPALTRQLKEVSPDINPLQFILNFLSLAFYPYILLPMIVKASIASEKEFNSILKDRVKLIPQWMLKILKPDDV